MSPLLLYRNQSVDLLCKWIDWFLWQQHCYLMGLSTKFPNISNRVYHYILKLFHQHFCGYLVFLNIEISLFLMLLYEPFIVPNKTLIGWCVCNINSFSTNVPIMDKPGIWFLAAKYLKNTCRRVAYYVKMQVIDLHLYLKCHSSAGVFQPFC